jgi:UDP-N-acetylglucosamine 4,6-dehydratase/5-epimerase
MSSFFRGKKILVTGGTGSIGSQIVRTLLTMQPRVVRIFARDEHKMYLFEQDIGDRQKEDDVRYFIGDVRDRDRLERALEGVDYVFHCAAYKHVPFCEYNSYEAVKTNVIGTQNLIEAAIAQNVKRVLLVSTDKAANPGNVMGATKLLAEKMMTSAMYTAGEHDIRFASVRFGNVLASRGSVIPLFCRQIRSGGPVTVTHAEMHRFFMSIPQAVGLTFKAMEKMVGGELFILKMPVVRLGDLVEVLIEELSPIYGKDALLIERRVIGPRPGEKMREVLMTDEEAQYASEEENMFIVRPPAFFSHQNDERAMTQSYSYDSSHLTPLSKTEIRSLITVVVKEYLASSQLL